MRTEDLDKGRVPLFNFVGFKCSSQDYNLYSENINLKNKRVTRTPATSLNTTQLINVTPKINHLLNRHVP